ncbi:MAG TPA: hypothetical protein VJ891_17390, partial [Casimicrobiaceae bacterium]|nr:hypothetical protein [Casimicrobiaceae bacterium]
MNYHLTRVRLCSVGPEPARFDPLDLRFLRHDHTGPAHSVLYLPNTGGKTVLLRLLFSVLHPPIVEKIGSEETSERRNKNLPGYVLERDTSHIVMEWRLATAGQFVDEEVLVTGLVAEWPGRKPSANAKDLDREWYSIRGSAAEVGIDRLVFDVSDETGARRRVPMQAFVESVEELGRGGGRNRPVVTTTRVQRTWMEHLDALGLDRALFRYQGKMNHNEAGASAIAQFKNDLDFIEFFLEAVMDPAELDTLDNELDEVANKVRRYPEYERRLRFEEAAVQELEPLAALVATYSDARATVERARQDGMGRVAAFHARAMIARELEGTERSRNAEKREEAVKLSRSADRARDEDRELRRIGTNFWVEEATKAHDDATVRVAAADLDIKSWAVAEEIARLRKAAAEVDALDLAYR